MKCRHHDDRESTHVSDIGRIPLCDECAKAESDNGLKVLKHSGYLWGFPVIEVHIDDTLDAEFIDA